MSRVQQDGIELGEARVEIPVDQSVPTTRTPSPSASFDHSHASGAGVESALLPADRGIDAWLFLAGSFLIEALIWGFALAFGVLQDYYTTHEPFAGGNNIAAIGTTATGLMYLGMPPCFVAILAYPSLRRTCSSVGLVILCTAVIGSSFATTTTQLLMSQGVLYAVGGCMTYAPTILFLNEWFVRRKGLAFGVVWAGTGVAGVVVPLLMNTLLEKYGFKIAMRAWAVSVFVLTAPTLYFIKPRLPPTRARRFDFSFLLSADFLILEAANMVQSLGFFLPSIYLPTYARELGASSIVAASTLVAFNVASVFSCIATGSLVDRYHVTVPTSVSALGSAVAVFLFWGFAGNLALLFAFCLIYGLFAGGYSSTWSGTMGLISRKTARAEPTLVFAFLAAGRGVGNVVSGPLSGILLKGENWHAKFGYGGSYGPLIVFTGVTACFGGMAIVARSFRGLL